MCSLKFMYVEKKAPFPPSPSLHLNFPTADSCRPVLALGYLTGDVRRYHCWISQEKSQRTRRLQNNDIHWTSRVMTADARWTQHVMTGDVH